MTRKKTIIDTDCGSDDAMAVAMALSDVNHEILFFTTVMGNVHVRQAASNLLTVIKETYKYFPKVYVGEENPLKREFEGSADTHGNDGMGDLDLIDYSLNPDDGYAVDKIIEALNKYDDVDIVELGPMSNLARVLEKDKDILKKANKIICMAGQGFGKGSQSEYAEFNIYQDPDACEILLKANLDNLYFVGWDACLGDCILNEDDIDEIKKSSSIGRFLIDCNSHLIRFNKERFKQICLDMADPAAMMAYLHPESIEACKRYYCSVEKDDKEKYGHLYMEENNSGNVYVISKINAKLYKKYLKELLK